MSVVGALTDSDAFRRFVKNGPGRVLYRSAAAEALNTRTNAARAWLASRRDPERFADVRTFCVFVGHNKSGTSLLGALLDAHPGVILSDEADVLRYVDAGVRRDGIFHIIDRAAEREARSGRVTARRLGGWSFAVPGGSQGRSARPLVVGDSTSGSTTRRLGEDPGLLDRVRAAMGATDVRLIQVIRNPFDPISLMMVRGGRTFSNAIEHYFTACERLEAIRRSAGPDALLPVRYETFLADPGAGLERVCGFLGVETDAEHVRACVAILRPRPDRSRDVVGWTRPWIDAVERRIADHDFLEGYAYAA